MNNIVLEFGKGKAFQYDRTATITKNLTLQIKKTPNNIALIFRSDTVTYQSLNEKIEQLACVLLNQGMKKNCVIGVCLEPSIETIVSLFAIWKIGGCYVPLDPLYPTQRLQFILKDSGAHLLITNNSLLDKNKFKDVEVLNIEKEFFVKDTKTTEFIECDVAASDIAYILYTSGSTGVPKGVKITHRATNNHMSWMAHYFNLSEKETFLLRTPLCFDPSIWEIILPLYIGSKLVIAPIEDNINPKKLVELIIENNITIIQLVPTLLNEILNQSKIKQCESLKHVFCGGESLSSKIKQLFFSKLKCDLHNIYGPTETTIDITSHTIQNSEHDINFDIIGKPIYNTQVYVINTDGKLCNVGEEGELYISSESMATGYHNRPELNELSFINDPINKTNRNKIYKTGDMVRWLEEGSLEFIGRTDDQVKLNGIRIEINEIISQVLSYTGVSNCVVLKATYKNGFEYLRCYIEASNKIDLDAIKLKLKENLPLSFLPKEFFVLDKFPLTINGKVDKAALRAHFSENLKKEIKISFDFDEIELLNVWKKILGVKNINVNDNIFELGTHSFLILKYIDEIGKKFGEVFTIKDIFLNPTIQQQANLFKAKKDYKQIEYEFNQISSPIIPLQSKGNKTPLFLIHPIAGTIFWYTKLAQLLGDDRPIYGIQDPSIEFKKPVFNDIKDMARFYAESIVNIQADGPYLLGGASFGATVALEVARFLEMKNKVVPFIIVLDGWAVYPDTLLDSAYFRESMLRQQRDLSERFKQQGITSFEDLFNIQWHRLGLLWQHTVQEIKYPIVLYKAEKILPAFQNIDAPYNHWEKYSQQPINYYVTPGNHETMFYEPNVDILADQIRDYLNKTKI